MDVLRYRGRVVTDADVAFIGDLITAHPTATRRALTELLRHADELPSRPQQWMPWNYREMLELSGTTTDPRDVLSHTAR